MNEEITLDSLVEVFDLAKDKLYVEIEDRGDDPDEDSEHRFLSIIHSNLITLSLELEDTNLSEEVKVAMAFNRVPGLFHLVNLYN